MKFLVLKQTYKIFIQLANDKNAVILLAAFKKLKDITR